MRLVVHLIVSNIWRFHRDRFLKVKGHWKVTSCVQRRIPDLARSTLKGICSLERILVTWHFATLWTQPWVFGVRSGDTFSFYWTCKIPLSLPEGQPTKEDLIKTNLPLCGPHPEHSGDIEVVLFPVNNLFVQKSNSFFSFVVSSVDSGLAQWSD